MRTLCPWIGPRAQPTIVGVPDQQEDQHAPCADTRRSGSEPEQGSRSDDDWLVDALEQAEASGRRAAVALGRSIDWLAELRRERQRTPSLEAILELRSARDGRATRRAAEDAFHEYQRAVMEVRALLIRALVDEGGSTLTEIAREMSVSRQKVAELYRVGRSLSERNGPAEADG